ncbi:hypothetical protein MAMC_00165 [Methylacidimicrobium cyclopophantes]|uniref:Uncharacterized protein n=1 Tax=Methylacidimicrobium cyclopophantes TaxID=1041766 RepID=A0A5E6M5N3_9BACT|nr:DUF4156 domain-containing protein [Methylacidimicrobium cyclopophantes]VVM04649.1 hypothetical protein MAMC_00165 [Methylacidimicrobium cyclopophantes]
MHRRFSSRVGALAPIVLCFFLLLFAPPTWASSGQHFAFGEGSSGAFRKVRLLGTFPAGAEPVGIVVGRADSLKGAAERLCKEAAKLGADGVVLIQTGYLFEKGDEVGFGGIAIRSGGLESLPR